MRIVLLLPLLACSDYEINKKTDGDGLRPSIEVSPRTVDFGLLPAGSTETAVVTVTNVGEGTLVLGDIRVPASGGFSVSLPEVTRLNYDESTELIVSLTPQAPEIQGDLIIENNDPAEPSALVELLGGGLYPVLTFDPNPVNFGTVPVGQAADETVELVNTGNAPLTVDTLLVIGEGFALTAPPVLPLTLDPGERAPAGITFTSAREGAYSGSLIGESNAVGSPTSVPLVAGTGLPVALCDVAPAEVAPLRETAVFQGSESYSLDGTGIVDYQWTIVDAPLGSSATMIGTGPDRDFVADMAGEYTGELIVTSGSGLVSEPCYATLNAIPQESLWVELYWSHDQDDMDLHLLAPGGSLRTDTDCYYANCTTGLEWGESGAGDNPYLDIDDIPGTGPENINIADPEESTYTVYVHDFTGSTPDYSGANDVTVNVYIDGVWVWTDTKSISGEDVDTFYCSVTFPDGEVGG
jgi:hypothetical protein